MPKYPIKKKTFVRKLRELTGLTQAQFARRHDLYRTTLSSIESGSLKSGRIVQKRIADALEVGVDEIFGSDGWPLVDWEDELNG